MMRALTLTQPWAGLVASGIKRVENRPRQMIKASDFGQWFAIHASRVLDGDVYSQIFTLAPELEPDRPVGQTNAAPWYKLSQIRGAVIGVAKIKHVLHGWSAIRIAEHRETLEQQFRILTGRDDQMRWCFGPVCYVLSDVIALPTSIAARGYQGFWTLDIPTEKLVREQMKSAGTS